MDNPDVAMLNFWLPRFVSETLEAGEKLVSTSGGIRLPILSTNL